MIDFITKVQNDENLNKNLINYKDTNYVEFFNSKNTIIKNFYYLDNFNNCININNNTIHIFSILLIHTKKIFHLVKVIPEKKHLDPEFYLQKYIKMLL